MTSRAVTGVVLAGGASARMGQPKAHLPWGGRTLIDHVLHTLQPVVDELIVVVKDRGVFRDLDARVVEDLVPDGHALGGLYTGLRLARHDRCFACACDMPFLNQRFIRFLIGEAEGADVVIPVTEGGFQPLHAVYARSAVPVIEEQLRCRQWELRDLVPKLSTRIVGPETIRMLDPAGTSCFNLNTPEDYATARRMSGRLTRIIESIQILR
jgi:molybdopterin-guanine dinucleotide biosynthesis protein A